MEYSNLYLNNYNFYCPATGKLIIDKDNFNPTEALLFMYKEGQPDLGYAIEEIKQTFSRCLKESDHFPSDKIFQEAFKNFIDIKLADRANYLLYTIYSNKSVIHLGIDMALSENDQAIPDFDNQNIKTSEFDVEFKLVLEDGNINAIGKLLQNDKKSLMILKGSEASLKSKRSLTPGYARYKLDLINANILKSTGEKYIFTKNHIFKSASKAACVVAGFSINGPKYWKTKDDIELRNYKNNI